MTQLFGGLNIGSCPRQSGPLPKPNILRRWKLLKTLCMLYFYMLKKHAKGGVPIYYGEHPLRDTPHAGLSESAIRTWIPVPDEKKWAPSWFFDRRLGSKNTTRAYFNEIWGNEANFNNTFLQARKPDGSAHHNHPPAIVLRGRCVIYLRRRIIYAGRSVVSAVSRAVISAVISPVATVVASIIPRAIVPAAANPEAAAASTMPSMAPVAFQCGFTIRRLYRCFLGVAIGGTAHNQHCRRQGQNHYPFHNRSFAEHLAFRPIVWSFKNSSSSDPVRDTGHLFQIFRAFSPNYKNFAILS